MPQDSPLQGHSSLVQPPTGGFFIPEGKTMAFTEAALQAQLDAEGLNCRITSFIPIVIASSHDYTDVAAQNVNSTSRKTGMLQIAQTNTAAQAAVLLKAALSA